MKTSIWENSYTNNDEKRIHDQVQKWECPCCNSQLVKMDPDDFHSGYYDKIEDDTRECVNCSFKVNWFDTDKVKLMKKSIEGNN